MPVCISMLSCVSLYIRVCLSVCIHVYWFVSHLYVCVQVYPCVSVCVINHTCLIGMLEGLNKLTLVKGLVQCLALLMLSINSRS